MDETRLTTIAQIEMEKATQRRRKRSGGTFLLLKTAKNALEQCSAAAHRRAIETSGRKPPWPSTVQPCNG
ncbi:hypothetical protein [Verminephrobacter aporrectodeae]|uniref:hypothetical protein n=1 Tax=Verminephrobacter aporrectodeae TaxID=1110389 RepID=UPI002244E9BF|nr:hypothetical protein [Verminephrobacter aporrectodeae]